MLVDAAWMERHGYSTSLRSQYVAGGWLERPARGTFKRPLGELTWEGVVSSLQHLMGHAVHVGGRTALELHGYAHYLSPTAPTQIELYSDKPLPRWLNKLPLEQAFHTYRTSTLFGPDELGVDTTKALDFAAYPLIVSTPERAWLEMLEGVPNRESFHNADKIGESLRTLSPRRMQVLLEACRSVKTKRLALWFAARHNHPWNARLEHARIDLGSGKRMLVRGGRLDPTYLITVPRDLNGDS
jgi:hypothetical protein